MVVFQLIGELDHHERAFRASSSLLCHDSISILMGNQTSRWQIMCYARIAIATCCLSSGMIKIQVNRMRISNWQKGYISLKVKLRSRINTSTIIRRKWKSLRKNILPSDIIFVIFSILFFNVQLFVNWNYFISAQRQICFAKRIHAFNNFFYTLSRKGRSDFALSRQNHNPCDFSGGSTLNISRDVRQICRTHWLVISRRTSGVTPQKFFARANKFPPTDNKHIRWIRCRRHMRY